MYIKIWISISFQRWPDPGVEKYSNLSDNYHFVPVGVKTYGIYGPQGIKLVKQISKNIQDATSEKLSTF